MVYDSVNFISVNINNFYLDFKFLLREVGISNINFLSCYFFPSVIMSFTFNLAFPSFSYI